jgi:hypothetical protein
VSPKTCRRCAVNQAGKRDMSRAYYSQRTGKTKTIDLATLCDALQCTYASFAEKQYFDETFGKDCTDGYIPGTAGSDIDGFFFTHLMTRGLWPITENYKNYTEENAFDVVELLYDVVSKPISGHSHDWNGCGMHYDVFDRLPGQKEFREAVNNFLRYYGKGFELLVSGEVVPSLSPQLSILVSNELPEFDPMHVEAPVQHAIAAFRKRGAGPEDRKNAVVELAGVLEFLRPYMRDIIHEKDENAMFTIANSFGLRHQKNSQQTDYDPLWLNWDFYLFLSTIHVLVRLLIKAKPTGGGKSK